MKINADKLGAALTAMAAAKQQEPDVAPTDPSSMLSYAGRKIADAYRRYDELKALATHLNGLQDSSPIPDSVQIENISIDFTVGDKRHLATIKTVRRVSDLSALIRQEIASLIDEMRTNAFMAKDAAETVEAACSRAQYTSNAQG